MEISHREKDVDKPETGFQMKMKLDDAYMLLHGKLLPFIRV